MPPQIAAPKEDPTSGGDIERNGPMQGSPDAAIYDGKDGTRGRTATAAAPSLCVCGLILAELLADRAHFAGDIVDIQNHLHHADLLVIDSFIKLCLDFFFTNVINLESQRDSSQRTCIGGVTIGDRLSSEAGSLTFSGAQQNDNVLGTVLFGEFLNTLLVFQIQCTSGRSDEALRRGENNFGTGRLSTRCDSGAGDAVTVTDDDDFLAI